MTQQPSPYFFRRVPPQPPEEPIDLQEYTVAEDQGTTLEDYWRLVKRYRWLILACTFAVLVAAALYTFTRTPLYTARATLLIERKPPRVLKNQQDTSVESGDYYGAMEYYKTQYEILKSRDLAAVALREGALTNGDLSGGKEADSKKGLVADLWGAAMDWFESLMPAAPKPKSSEPASVDVKSAIGTYISMLEIKPVQGTSLVRVGFSTPDPALSARLANTHASAYVRYGLELRSQTNEEALEFLQKKLLELKERVEKSEAALNSYRRDKGIISLDDKENIILDRLVDLNKRLTAAEADRIGLEAQVRIIRRGNYDALPVVANNSIIQGLRNEIGRLENERIHLSKEFKPGYPPLDKINAQLENSRRRMLAEIQSEIKTIESAYQAAVTREQELRARMQEQKKATLNLKDSAVQYAILAREVDTNRQLYDSVLQRMKEMGVAAEVRTSNVYLMDKAEPPAAPSYPNTRRTLLLGLLLGLAGGVGLAFLLERLDNTFKGPEEVERYIQLPNLAVVPDFSLLNKPGYGYVSRLVNRAASELPAAIDGDSNKQLVLAHHPLSVVVEAYRMLRSSLLLSRAGEPPHIVLITSATRGEGKTTTLINTAIVFAQMGVRTLVIDADLRRPRCHKVLEVENGVGLSELLAGQIDVQKAIKPTAADGLFLMSSGAACPNPAELLGSKKMNETLLLLKEQYDYIFVDSSPVMAVSDAVMLSTMVEGVLLVVDGKTSKTLVREARARLSNPYTKILGVLLNRVDTRNGDYASYYRHYYHYYHDDDQMT
ncbi:MAG: polysaccharide biosynthesis tyrosine autokinase [Deltaproteobacteria bacterium]|nr:polysaccharide biosynthesis tyrosine autokinase [Deltaproteobacteria bacterium]